MKLVFATQNKNKLNEIQSLAPEGWTIIGADDLGIEGDIPEDHDTLEENAKQKAHFVRDRFNVNCFSDDTGLEIEALDGRPGVYSARYAGEDCIAENNITKVLAEMDGMKNRDACFKTVIALTINGEDFVFEGQVEGTILEARKGEGGFGYDPIFQPKGFNSSFAEMSLDQKNNISHRARAVKKFIDFLENSSFFQ